MHFYVIKLKTLKRILLCAIAIVLLGVNFASSQAPMQVFLYSSPKKIPIYCVDESEKYVALTFDAAWGSDKTKDILKTLKDEDVAGTFFLVGFWVDKNEDLVKKIDEMGFEIGTHSNTHPDLTKLSRTQVELELKTSKEKIENITKKSVKVFRAPFGAYNNTVIDVAESLGLNTIQWDVDSLDWKGISADNIISNILKRVKPGSIILCHNNSDNIVPALSGLILGLKQRGYKFKTVSSLVFEGDYRIDSTGKQVKV